VGVFGCFGGVSSDLESPLNAPRNLQNHRDNTPYMSFGTSAVVHNFSATREKKYRDISLIHSSIH